MLQRYAADGIVKLEISVPPLPAIQSDDKAVVETNMPPYLNDCLYRNLYRYRYVVVTDMDEMIVPRQYDNY